MNEFKESLSVSRENSGKIIMTDPLKNLLIELMKGNISKNQVMDLTGIGDKRTIEIKIEEVVAKSPELKLLYEEYMSRKSSDFNGYNFRPEAIEMLRKNYSQSVMAERINISRRTFSTKMKKLAQENKDNILGKLLLEHADRQMKRKKVSNTELLQINIELDQYEAEFPVGPTRDEKRSSIEIRRDNALMVLQTIEELLGNGYTLKQLDKEGIISESSYRRYKEEAINLSKILEDNTSKGEK